MDWITLTASILGVVLGLMVGLKFGALVQKQKDHKQIMDYEVTIDEVIKQNEINAKKIINLEIMQKDLQGMIDIYKASI